MTKRVQLAGETADIEQFLVGLERELRVDTTNESLRLHDGVKEGGYEFLNRDASDNRYQFHSAELDGFEFGAQEKGILTRTGPAQYKIRKLISSNGDIDYGTPSTFRGTPGDFNLNLAATIGSAHTWDGVQTYTTRIVADDGIAGDSFGTHHGDVVGNVTGNLTGDAHGDATGSFTGDVDVRGHTIQFDDGQIPESAIDPTAFINRGVPMGAIMMWSGTVDTIPESWALCDGTAGTPDLRNRFILGAGAGSGIAAPLSSGGSESATITGTIASSGAHVHPLDVDPHSLSVAELPAHHHPNGVSDDNFDSIFIHGTVASGSSTGLVSNHFGGFEGLTGDTGTGTGHTHTGNTTNSGAHTHDLTLDAADIIPPYYALCFIMKTV